MTSVLLAPLVVVRSVRHRHPVEDANGLFVERDAAFQGLPVPDGVMGDDVSILAPAVHGDADQAGADALNAGRSGDCKLWRAEIAELLDKVQSNASPRHLSDGSVTKSRFSGG